MESNRKLNFSLFEAFSRHRACNVKLQSSTREERSKTTPKKETFDFRLPSVAHERLCFQAPKCHQTLAGDQKAGHVLYPGNRLKII